jgi:hypothetical protein
MASDTQMVINLVKQASDFARFSVSLDFIGCASPKSGDRFFYKFLIALKT